MSKWKPVMGVRSGPDEGHGDAQRCEAPLLQRKNEGVDV